MDCYESNRVGYDYEYTERVSEGSAYVVRRIRIDSLVLSPIMRSFNYTFYATRSWPLWVR